MFKTELVVVALCSTVSPGDQSRGATLRVFTVSSAEPEPSAEVIHPAQPETKHG